ncbi:MAG: hypothetical protein Q8L29_02650 [archaeon]|nr:hypothetical protein [archaeon]
MAKFPYKHGNFTDRVKNSNLGALIESMMGPLEPFSYIELHSGEGIYNIESGNPYFGSAYMAFLKALGKNSDAHFLLHEIDEEKRKKLRKNLEFHKNVRVYEDWRNNLVFCLESLGNFRGKNTLIVSDPCYMAEHAEVMEILPHLLLEDANLFMYVPENLRELSDSAVVDKTRSIIKEKTCLGKKAIDLMSPSENGLRIDHNIVVADYEIMRAVEGNHKAFVLRDSGIVRKLSERELERFSNAFDFTHRIL